jgi:hypothetical protein
MMMKRDRQGETETKRATETETETEIETETETEVEIEKSTAGNVTEKLHVIIHHAQKCVPDVVAKVAPSFLSQQVEVESK